MNKLVINDLTTGEYVLVYSMLMSIIAFVYCYNTQDSFENIKTLSYSKFALIALSGFLSLYLWNLSFGAVRDGTIVKTSFVMQGTTLILLAVIGTMFFNENMPIGRAIGLILILLGLIALASQ